MAQEQNTENKKDVRYMGLSSGASVVAPLSTVKDSGFYDYDEINEKNITKHLLGDMCKLS